MWWLSRVLRPMLVVVMLSGVAPSRTVLAQEYSREVDEGHAAISYVGAVMTNLVYLPAKLLYAGFGGVVGGLGFVFTGGDPEAFHGVWEPASTGTYVVTPSMLEGKEPVRFVGP